MSYCRFHNTRNDMMDCLGAMQEYTELDNLSDMERSALFSMLDIAREMIDMEDEVLDYLKSMGKRNFDNIIFIHIFTV